MGQKFDKVNIEPSITVTSDNVSQYLNDAY
jgi:hypothetical protein